MFNEDFSQILLDWAVSLLFLVYRNLFRDECYIVSNMFYGFCQDWFFLQSIYKVYYLPCFHMLKPSHIGETLQSPDTLRCWCIPVFDLQVVFYLGFFTSQTRQT